MRGWRLGSGGAVALGTVALVIGLLGAGLLIGLGIVGAALVRRRDSPKVR